MAPYLEYTEHGLLWAKASESDAWLCILILPVHYSATVHCSGETDLNLKRDDASPLRVLKR